MFLLSAENQEAAVSRTQYSGDDGIENIFA